MVAIVSPFAADRALVRDRVPVAVAGIIYRPTEEKLFAAENGRGLMVTNGLIHDNIINRYRAFAVSNGINP